MSDTNKDIAGQPGMSPKDKQMMTRRSFLGKMGVALGLTTAAVIGPEAVRKIVTSHRQPKNRLNLLQPMFQQNQRMFFCAQHKLRSS